MEPTSRNAVIVLIASLAMGVSTFRVHTREGGTDLPYDYFLWGALVFSLIVVWDLLASRTKRVATNPWENRVHSEGLLTLITVLVIGNVITLLSTWRSMQEALPESLGIAEENRRQAVFHFVVGTVLLFARGLSTEETGSASAGTQRFSGWFADLLLLLLLAYGIELAVRHVVQYPNLPTNHATAFGVTLAVVILVRDGIRRLRAGADDRSFPPGPAR